MVYRRRFKRRQFRTRRKRPYLRYNRKRSFAGRYRRRTNRRRKVSLRRAMRTSVVPFQKSAVLTYFDGGWQAALSASGTANWEHSWSGNSLFDPDYTGVGVQPKWYTWYSGQWRFYRVVASKITVYVTPLPSNTPSLESNLQVTIWPSEYTTSSLATPVQNFTTPNYKTFQVDLTNVTKKHKFSHFCYTKPVIYRNEYWEANWADFAHDPSHEWVWRVRIDEPNRLVDRTAVVAIKVKYYTQVQVPVKSLYAP